MKYLLNSALLSICLVCAPLCFSEEVSNLDTSLRQIQQSWDSANYIAPEKEKARLFSQLSSQASQLSQQYPSQAEPLVWQGIIYSSLAKQTGGLSSLKIAKDAKKIFERAIEMDHLALKGSALLSLGVLYYKVPGWPIGFGDKHKAESLLLQALSLNPDGLDSNYFYADYLISQGESRKAVIYLNKALNAPERANREIADRGRKAEAQKILNQLRVGLNQ